MANETIDRHLITEFSDRVHVEAQQMKARLRPHVQIKQMSGDVWAYDTIGQVEAEEIQGRHQKINFSSIEHNRRKISRVRFGVALPIDASDVRGALMDPQSNYAALVVQAMERRFDRLVIEKMFADVSTGRDFDTTVTFATEGLTAIDATAGLTYEKLLEIKRNFTDNEVGNDMPETFVMGISGDEEESLMKETELISGDFSRQMVVDQGEIVRAAGFQLVKYGAAVNSPMLAEAGGERSCFAMSTRAMCVGMSKEIAVEVQKRTDYWETDQVVAIVEMGAVRTEGILIQKVRTTI